MCYLCMYVHVHHLRIVQGMFEVAPLLIVKADVLG